MNGRSGVAGGCHFGRGPALYTDPTLQPLNAGQGSAFAVVGCGNEHSRNHQFEVQPRRGGSGHLGEGGVDDIGCAAQFCRTEARGLLCHEVDLFLLDAPQHRSTTLRGRADHDEVAHSFQQVFDKTARVLARLDDPVYRGERRRGILDCDGVDHFGQEGTVGVAEQRDGALVLHGRPFGSGDQLVQQRQGVANRATARAHDERQHASLDLDLLTLGQLLHILEHLGWRHEPERVVVGARADRADDLFGFGGREDELDVLWRLFNNLEQGVESLRCDHMRFVEDKDLVAVPGRCEHGPFAQVSGVVDTIVAGRVDLDDIQRAAAVARQLDTGRADTARGVGRTFDAVEAAGEDARRGRLAATARTAKQIGVVDAVGAQCRHQRIRHLRLPDQFGKVFWPVTAI